MLIGPFSVRVSRHSPPYIAPNALVMYPKKNRHGERRGMWTLAILTGAYSFAVSYYRW